MQAHKWFLLLLCFVAPLAFAAQSSAPPAAHRVFRVSLDGASAQPVSGRLLLFAISAQEAKAQAKDGKVTAVDTSPFSPTQTAVAAMDVTDLAPGASVLIDADALAFPEGFSKLAAGDYAMQAVLDTRHTYNYSGRGAGDLVSEVTAVTFGHGAGVPTLKLTTRPDRGSQGVERTVLRARQAAQGLGQGIAGGTGAQPRPGFRKPGLDDIPR